MSRSSTFTWRGERFRVTAWRELGTSVQLSLDPRGHHPTVDGVGRCVRELRRRGVERVTTSALHADDLEPFLSLGFDPVEELVVLAHDLTTLPDAPTYPIRSFRHRHRSEVLAVDHRAFRPQWRLDEAGLDDAFCATPRTRGRLVRDAATVVAYTVSGIAGREAFLQRLAVSPEHHGSGMGRSLTVDALQWVAEQRVDVMYVNTQNDNRRALELYDGLGFRRCPRPLTVLSLSLRLPVASPVR